MRTVRARHVVLLAALVLGGCDANLGVPSVLNVGKVRSQIARQTRRHAAVPASVTCPDQIRLKEGQTFTCDAHFAVGHIKVTVTQTDKQGHVSYVYPHYDVIDIPRLAVRLEHKLTKRYHKRIRVLCPQPVLARAGENFTCLAAALDGLERKVVVMQTGSASGPTFEIKKATPPPPPA